MKKVFVSLLFLCTLSIPVFSQPLAEPDDFLNSDFHKHRREQVRMRLPANSVTVFFANPVRNRANDVDYVYHQDPDFYYLTGYREPHSMLLIFSEEQHDANGDVYDEILFAQPRNPRAEMWTGRRLGVKGVEEKLGFSKVLVNKAFHEHDIEFAEFDKVLFDDFKNDLRNKHQESALY